MYEYGEKSKKTKSRAVANTVTQKKSKGNQTFGFVDNRVESVAQRKLKEKVNSSQQVFKATCETTTDKMMCTPLQRNAYDRKNIQKSISWKNSVLQLANRNKAYRATKKRSKPKNIRSKPKDKYSQAKEYMVEKEGSRDRRLSGVAHTYDSSQIIDSIGNGDYTEIEEKGIKGISMELTPVNKRDKDTIKFFYKGNVGNKEKLLELLDALDNKQHQEAAPRSGIGRAASDDDDGKERATHGAEYSPRKGDGLDIKDREIPDGKTTFKLSFNNNTIESKITHTGSWKKGDRGKGQIAVMGNQNARNHATDVHRKINKIGPEEEAEGRWEWLHLVGSSLGGPNVVGNLIAGSYDENTRMIPFEHRAALWGQKKYFDEKHQEKYKKEHYDKNSNTYNKPYVEVKAIAKDKLKDTDKDDFLYDTIEWEAKRYDNKLIEKKFDKVLNQTVVTKSQYKELEKNAENQVDNKMDLGSD